MHRLMIKTLALVLCSLISVVLSSSCFPAERSIADAVVLPSDANLINVQAYGATGDGITDDTAAIRRAIQENINQHRTLLFPQGTYLISDTLNWQGAEGAFYAFLTFQGEGVAKTFIRLKDSAPGFTDPANPKPMTRSGSIGSRADGAGNQAHNNYIFDLTFDVGSGNPGAIGVDFTASNTGAMENVAIVSGDGQGAVGLNLTREVGPCLIKKVSVNGFDIGISISSALYSITFEDIQLENQNIVGIKNIDQVVSIRKLISHNSVPAVSNTGDWAGPIVLIDSQLQGGSPQAAAIENTTHMLVRNVTVEGYGVAIKSGNETLTASTITEFVSAPATALFKAPIATLNLPIEETPEFSDSDLNNWANVETYGAIRDDEQDDSGAVQSAIDSGKAIVYFPQGTYSIEQPITVRGNVHRIIGFQSILASASPKLRFENSHPVILERFNFFNGGQFESVTDQPVVIRHTIGPVSIAGDNSSWFIENVVTAPLNIHRGQKIYARQLNCELPPPEPMVKNDGGLFWVLGYKTEFGNTAVATLNGGKTEILGGLFYPAQGVHDPQIPLLINHRSFVSATYREIAFGSTYTVHVQETRGEDTRTLRRDVLGAGAMVAMPLYAGYK
jgi:hypothetical protein